MEIKKAFKYLESDPVMKYLISKLGREINIEDRYNKNYAKAIAELIIEQQISFKVAISIKKKFNHLIYSIFKFFKFHRPVIHSRW